MKLAISACGRALLPQQPAAEPEAFVPGLRSESLRAHGDGRMNGTDQMTMDYKTSERALIHVSLLTSRRTGTTCRFELYCQRRPTLHGYWNHCVTQSHRSVLTNCQQVIHQFCNIVLLFSEVDYLIVGTDRRLTAGNKHNDATVSVFYALLSSHYDE